MIANDVTSDVDAGVGDGTVVVWPSVACMDSAFITEASAIRAGASSLFGS